MKPESSRPRRDVDEAAAEVAAATKIRRRCAPSSSSEPRSTRRTLRLKRRVRLIGQTGSPRKTTSSSRRRTRMSESSRNQHHHRRPAGVETRPTSAASARNLVSALWQLDKGGGACEGDGDVGWDAAAARRSSDHHRRSASLELSNLARRKSNALEADGERGWHNGHAHGHWFSDVISNGGTMEATQGLASPCPSGDRTAQLRELYNSMTASKELVRVLANVLAPGALNPTAASLLVALRSELDVARARARQLAREQRRRRGDEVSAEERLAEEMREWKSRHREKAARAVASELDAERRARQRAERVSKKLGEALAGAEASLREARWELERERKARERLENEGEEEEELRRREAERARQKLEREREMLQLADELREDRVRMNLAEARLQFEEKSAVVDRLRQELEAFLGRDDKDGRGSPAHDDGNAADDRRLQLVLASESVVNGIDRVAIHTNGEDGGGNDGCGEVGDDSDGSDIELNMDGNIRDYSWSHSTAASKATTAKNAASGSSRHGSISDRGTEGASDRRSQRLGEAPERNWNDQECSDDDDDDVDRTTTKEDIEEDAERYEAIKNLREQMLAGHGFFSLSQQGGAADAGDRDHHRHPGFVCQVDQGKLW